MVRGRRSGGLLVGALLLALGAGCGPSQEEYDKKAREVEDLKNRLAAEQAASRKAQGELADAKARVEQLKEQLRAAGVDISNLNANLEQQARALEDYKKRAEQLEAIRQRFETLKKKLDELTKFGLKVQIRKGRIVIQLPGDVLFDSGRETLKKEGKDILTKVAEVVRNDKGLSSRTYQVAGHTDNQPFKGGFKDNWGLSAMRAREVLVFLVGPPGKDNKEGGGLNPLNWSAVGYGDTDPVTDNTTAEGRQGNRRVELVIMPNVEEMIDLKTITK
ncbi:MAG: flagellar motor protein MotB [Polyangiaceae bacterium]|nr:flagellar motor protein MotB [Polyangiaceae bacterium]